VSVEHADALQDLLERDGREHWPLPSERAVHRQIAQWRAFRESDAPMLRHLCDWHNTDHRHREYLVDPLPERIADAFADLIFGAEPEFDAPKVTESAPDDQGNAREVSKPGPDQELLDDLVDENDLPTQRRARSARARRGGASTSTATRSSTRSSSGIPVMRSCRCGAARNC
jgi:hypothetical protein